MRAFSQSNERGHDLEIQYDTASDMLYIGLHSRTSVVSEEVAPCIVLDYDKDNGIVGIER